MVAASRDGVLETVVSSLDISPTDFAIARDRYHAVADWLKAGEYASGDHVDVYIQGSFKLGTVIRPYVNGQDADYDIDQVCEISGNVTQARQLKHDVGDQLRAKADYQRMLDAEGRRCWTLQYASADGRPGFHLDVLPSCPAGAVTDEVRITHKEDGAYSWRPSNPKGYFDWFSQKSDMSPERLQEQMRSIYSANRSLYASVEDVPTQLSRTPLQRAIQVMKRHRDVWFSGRDGAPISIILTTICAHRYRGLDTLSTIRGFANYAAGRLTAVVGKGSLPVDSVLDYVNGRWVVKNPAAGGENFADRWADNPELAENFFAWVYKLRRDLEAFDDSGHPPDLGLEARGIQSQESAYSERLGARMSSGPVGSSTSFLNLIHLGIERKVSWEDVKRVASRNVDLESDALSKDIAWVNYYQVKIHSGEGITEADRQHIRSIRGQHSSEPAFAFCCSVLLGSATEPMLRACVESGDDVLGWPITRLALGQIPASSNLIVPARKVLPVTTNS